ncbi:MAG: 4Fe-4S binding protein [Deltaproteobacteria bacterium]|nr:4Fe-4S binding protein [Deltaproteobacteria bacterium]
MMTPLFKNMMSVKPKVSPKKCLACGVCVKACPMAAITLVKGESARIDDRRCVRCYCCHEMCPEKAIDLDRSLLYRILKPAGTA